jgi:hypothetical protein
LEVNGEANCWHELCSLVKHGRWTSFEVEGFRSVGHLTSSWCRDWTRPSIYGARVIGGVWDEVNVTLPVEQLTSKTYLDTIFNGACHTATWNALNSMGKLPRRKKCMIWS